MEYKITYSNAKNWWVKLMSDWIIRLTIPYFKSKDKLFEKKLKDKWRILFEKQKNKNLKKIETIWNDYIMIFWEKINLKEIDGDINNYINEKLYNISLPIIEKYSKQLWIPYKKLHIKTLKTKWGSCSFINNISLNSKLIHLPLKYIRYVSIHEVCHLKEKNHSKEFWNLVWEFCKDYKEIRKELKKMYF